MVNKMSDSLEKSLTLIGRFFLSLIFILSAIFQMMDWTATTGYMQSKGMPLVGFLLLMSIIFRLLGGISILLGYKAKIGAWLLIIFLVPATFVFHNFWAIEGMEGQLQFFSFLKNFSIIGGLILVVVLGSGRLSLDNRKQ